MPGNPDQQGFEPSEAEKFKFSDQIDVAPSSETQPENIEQSIEAETAELGKNITDCVAQIDAVTDALPDQITPDMQSEIEGKLDDIYDNNIAFNKSWIGIEAMTFGMLGHLMSNTAHSPTVEHLIVIAAGAGFGALFGDAIRRLVGKIYRQASKKEVSEEVSKKFSKLATIYEHQKN